MKLFRKINQKLYVFLNNIRTLPKGVAQMKIFKGVDGFMNYGTIHIFFSRERKNGVTLENNIDTLVCFYRKS